MGVINPVPQSKLISPSILLSEGVPSRKILSKYSPRRPPCLAKITLVVNQPLAGELYLAVYWPLLLSVNLLRIGLGVMMSGLYLELVDATRLQLNDVDTLF